MATSNTFGRQVGIGFLLVAATLAIAVVATIFKVTDNSEIIQRVSNLRAPTTRECLRLLSLVNETIGQSRGFALTRDKSFNENRLDAWSEIDEVSKRLNDLSKDWGDAQSAANLQAVLNDLDKLKSSQEHISAVAAANPGEAAALVRSEGAPLGRNIRNALEKIVDVQEQLFRNDRANSERSMNELIWMEWILFAIGVLLSGGIGFYITRSVTRPLRDTVEATRRIAEEDFDFTVNLRGPQEVELMGVALEKMRGNLKSLTEGLRDKNRVLQEQRWIIDGQVGLLENMSGEQDLKGLARSILKFLSERIGAQMSAFYLKAQEALTPVEAYAHHGGEVLNSKPISLGEGLLGQVARDRHALSTQNVPQDYFKIHSSLGGTTPRNLSFLPVHFDNELLAVMEFASLEAPTKTQQDFLNTTSKNIGIAINLNLATQKTKELLEETQAQAEELQTQQEELKVANEELELKTRSLEASEEELKSQQEELKSTNEELEEQTSLLEREKEALGLRTTELESTKKALETRAQEVEQVSRYKSEFLANMSHELRTPLNSILMLSQSLNENRGGNLQEKQLKAVKTIHSSGSDLLTLIEDILDLSKIEAGRLDIKPEHVSIQDLFESMRESFELMAKEAGLKFNIHIDPALPKTIFTDITRIKQVLKNLLSNAFKFTNTGSVTLEARRSTKTDPRDGRPMITLSVVDTGIGIPAQSQKAVFDAFKQLDAKTTRKYGGTGLGLSIVKELVSLLGAEIHLTSQEGTGTTVTVDIPENYIPARKTDKTAAIESPPELSLVKPAKPATVAIEDDREWIRPNDAVVLIVEDDLRFANSLLDLCRDNGFKGVVLSDGVSAVKLAEEMMPRGILLDLSLPELDGTGVLKLLKDNVKTRHIPIQVITGHDRKNEVMQAGAMGFLKKPADKTDLVEVLHKISKLSSQGNNRVLVIEDNEAQRKSIREFIEVPGVEVLEAANGEQALSHVKADGIGCIILDLNLPDISGNEWLKRAKALLGHELPPVIIYTGKDLSDSELRELQRDSKSIIVKGVKSPERLFDETMMFLHRLQKDLPTEKKKLVENLHDPTRILKGKTVLVVDDDQRNIQSLTHLLEDHGVEIVVAENGKIALERLNSLPTLDLVLMDMMMPEMDGYEATRRIRAGERFKHIPIVALTARAMKGEREKCLEAGCNDYLAKPIDNDKLISLMRVWLYRSA